MQLYIKNRDLETVKIIDEFESLIWTDRWQSLGDFELYCAFDSDVFDVVQKDFYAVLPDSEYAMVIEERLIHTDVEEGIHLTIKGRSLESLLTRRIVWKRTQLSGNFQTEIQRLLNENAISPSDPSRRIPGLVFHASTDPIVCGKTIETQLFGENLYDKILELCYAADLDFDIVLDASNNFVFELYSGTDRSYGQIERPFVVFSPKFENLLSSLYTESQIDYKNVALIAGEPIVAGAAARRVMAAGGWTELDRREMFVDAPGITSDPVETGGTVIAPAVYDAQLANEGYGKLAELQPVSNLECEVDTTISFKYGIDFFLGDWVQVSNEFGMDYSVLVTEMVYAQDSSGLTAIPKFKLK